MTTESLPPPTVWEELKQMIFDRSREKYGTPKHIVESIAKNIQAEVGNVATPLLQPKLPKEKLPEKISSPTIEVDKVPEIPTFPKSEFETTPEVTIAQKVDTTQKLVKQKEQSQHRYLQTFIKKMAESRGYKVLLEELTPDGKGRIDVSLERNKRRIAVEICVTTEMHWEMHNIQKCITAGYNLVVACSPEKETIAHLRTEVENTFSRELLSQILIMEPESLFEFLDTELAKEASTENRMKGYRVKTEYNPVTEIEMLRKKEVTTKLIMDAKRKKDK